MRPLPIIIDRLHLRKIYGIKASNSTLLRWEASGDFPARVRPGGGHTIGWVRDEIEDYVRRLARARRVRR